MRMLALIFAESLVSCSVSLKHTVSAQLASLTQNTALDTASAELTHN